MGIRCPPAGVYGICHYPSPDLGYSIMSRRLRVRPYLPIGRNYQQLYLVLNSGGRLWLYERKQPDGGINQISTPEKPPSISPVEAFWISHIGEAPVRASRIAIDRSLSGSGVASTWIQSGACLFLPRLVAHAY
jgi:hypothetical protein